MDKKKRKEIERLSEDHERWDRRELGASAEHMVFVSDEEQKEIEEGLGLQMISLRLNKTLIDQFKELARLEGIGYQPLMRRVLSQYSKDNEHKLTALLSAEEAAKRADRIFTMAVKLKAEIPKLEPLSTERISAESTYCNSLGQAQHLFARAIETSNTPASVLQLAKLRMTQISAMFQETMAEHRKIR